MRLVTEECDSGKINACPILFDTSVFFINRRSLSFFVLSFLEVIFPLFSPRRRDMHGANISVGLILALQEAMSKLPVLDSPGMPGIQIMGGLI